MVRFGLNIGQQQCSIDELRAVWDRAEAAGFEWLSVWDHFYPDNLPYSDPCFEGMALHAAMAERTSTARLGSTVYCAAYRHPGVLANAVTTIDHLSGGRLELGLGAGWHEPEFAAYGIPFESPGTRLRRLAETVEIVRGLWREKSFSYEGEFYTLTNAFCSPGPVQQYPRIWLGTLGEQKGLRLAGELADAWNCSLQPAETFARKRQKVLSYAADPSTYQTSVNLPFVPASAGEFETELRRRFGPRSEQVHDLTLTGSADRIRAMIGPYVEAGADWINLSVRAPFDLDAFDWFGAEIIGKAGPP
jgi:alkanesulfonate monooxygenase SsuD/methylene tetrahydromethanopterin reductase-like flavin-dependent oxidoreductase (luciferase family)